MDKNPCCISFFLLHYQSTLNTKKMQDFKFSQKCCLSLRSSGIQHCVNVQVVNNIRIIKQSKNNYSWTVSP